MKNGLILILIFFYSVVAHATKLYIVHDNDTHGRFFSDEEKKGGMAQRRTLIKQMREKAKAEGANLLVLSGGDYFTGTAESDLHSAEPDRKAMDLDYDATTIGNHEFDKGKETLFEHRDKAKFKFVCANIKDSNGDYVFQPYITREIGGGKKVAIIGFTTPDMPNMTPREKISGLVFEDPIKSHQLVKDLKKDHDYVIALSHLGYYPNESHGIEAYGDETLAKLMPELDLIIGAHTHTPHQKPVEIGKTLIVQTEGKCTSVGVMELDLAKPGKELVSYELRPLIGYAEDKEVLQMSKEYINKTNELLNKKVGVALGKFKDGQGFLEVAEQPLGKLVAEAHRKATSGDFSILQSKAVRSGLPGGKLLLKDLYNISPYGNNLTTADLTGDLVWKTVQTMHDSFTAQGDVAYFSDSLKIKMKNNKIEKILLNGKNIPNTPTGKYRVAANNYLTEVMPEFKFLKNHPSFNSTSIIDVNALMDFIKEKKVIDPKDFTKKTYPLPKNCKTIADMLKHMKR